MRIIVVAGARPNFIKIAPLLPALEREGLDAKIAHTGQHYDTMMSDVFFDDLNIDRPAWLLEVGSGTHSMQTGIAMTRLEAVFREERPDAVIVVGDVNSTLAGALAAAKVGIPLVHLEAGLRSWDTTMPEEMNRILVDRVSSLLFTPTPEAGENLAAEGASPARIQFVGNIMAEALERNKERACSRVAYRRYGLTENEYILATCHRPENTDDHDALEEIIAALEAAPLPVLFPVHPRTHAVLRELGIGTVGGNIILADPVGYLDMISLQNDARLVVTDSGGMQEESCLLGIPCVTIRRSTERAITLELKANRLVSADCTQIEAAIDEALDAPLGWGIPKRWDTHVSERVAHAIRQAGEEGFPSIEVRRA